MIDRVVSVSPQVDVLVAQSTVPAKSPVFEGHFPGLPLVPGVLLIETMAQASGFLVMSRNRFSRMPFLAGVKEAKLRTFVEPETALAIEARLEHDGSGFAITRASIKSGERKICDAQLTFKTMEFPDESFAGMIADRARELGVDEALLG